MVVSSARDSELFAQIDIGWLSIRRGKFMKRQFCLRTQQQKLSSLNFLIFALALAVVLVPNCCYADKLTITTDPSGARVEINGQYAGTTPLVLRFQSNDISGAHGVHWKAPAVMTLSVSGCASGTSSITPDILHSKIFHLKLDCFQSHLEAGNRFFQNEQFLDATREYERALQLDQTQSAAAYNLGLAHLRAADYQESKVAFDKAIRIKPDFAEAHTMKGLACGNLMQHDEAITSFKRALQLDSNLSLAHAYLAWQYNLIGKRGQALASVEKAIQLKPDFIEAYDMKASILEQMGRIDDAVAAAQQAVHLNPASPEALLALGWEMDEAGKPGKALEYARKAAQIKPGFRMAETNMCRAYNDLGRYGDALQICQSALVREPADPETLFYLAIAYERLGQTDQALRSYRRSVDGFKKLDEPDGYFYFLWGNADYRLGRFTQALEDYSKALHQRPSFSAAHLNRGIAYARLGRDKEANDEYETLTAIDAFRAERLRGVLRRQQDIQATLNSSSLKGPSKTVPSKSGSILNLRSNADCTISIDGGWRVPLFSGRSQAVSLPSGRHSIMALGTDGQQLWQTTVVLLPRLHTTLVVPIVPKHIDLKKEAERSELATEIVQLGKVIEANRERTSEIDEKRAKLIEQRQAWQQHQDQLRSQAQAIVTQIQTYETQVDKEYKQAEQDERDAQLAYQLAAINNGQNTTLSKMATTTNVAAYLAKKQSAENHRQRATQLIAEMDKLSHSLYALTKSQ